METKKIIVFDNWLEDSFLKFVQFEFLFNTNYTYGAQSNQFLLENKKQEPFFWHAFERQRDKLHQFQNGAALIISYKLIDFLKNRFNHNVNIRDYYLNLQNRGQDGIFHEDVPIDELSRKDRLTALLMITNTAEDGSGCFEYLNEKKEKNKIDFVVNRLIIFDSTITHRGMSYNTFNPRITLAAKLNIVI